MSRQTNKANEDFRKSNKIQVHEILSWNFDGEGINLWKFKQVSNNEPT